MRLAKYIKIATTTEPIVIITAISMTAAIAEIIEIIITTATTTHTSIASSLFIINYYQTKLHEMEQAAHQEQLRLLQLIGPLHQVVHLLLLLE